MPYFLNFFKSISCEQMSDAFFKSKRRPMQYFFSFSAVDMELVRCIKLQYPQKKLRQQPNFSRFLIGWLKKRVADIKQLFADLGSVMHLV
jgi:hypothetical protein